MDDFSSSKQSIETFEIYLRQLLLVTCETSYVNASTTYSSSRTSKWAHESSKTWARIVPEKTVTILREVARFAEPRMLAEASTG